MRVVDVSYHELVGSGETMVRSRGAVTGCETKGEVERGGKRTGDADYADSRNA